MGGQGLDARGPHHPANQVPGPLVRPGSRAAHDPGQAAAVQHPAQPSPRRSADVARGSGRLAAATCFAVLAVGIAADIAANWWVQQLASRQEAPASLPPLPDRFTEPSVPLTLLEAFSKIAVGQGPREMLAGGANRQLPAAPTGVPLSAEPALPPSLSGASTLGMWLVTLYLLVAGPEQASWTDPGPGTSREDLQGLLPRHERRATTPSLVAFACLKMADDSAAVTDAYPL